MKPTVILLILAMSALPKAFATGDKGGNGGNAVVCFSDPEIPRSILTKKVEERVIPSSALSAITSIEALDLMDAENPKSDVDQTPKEVVLFMPLPHEATSVYLERLAKRTELKMPILANQIRNGMREFAGKITYLTGSGPKVGVTQVYDIGDLPYQIDKSRCVISTIMNQNGLDDTLEMTVDSRLYSHPKNSEMSRKALMLHEMIYLWGRKKLHANSEPTRKVTSLLLQANFSRAAMAGVLVAYFTQDKNDLFFETGYKDMILNSIQAFGETVNKILGVPWSEYKEHNQARSDAAEGRLREIIGSINVPYWRCISLRDEVAKTHRDRVDQKTCLANDLVINQAAVDRDKINAELESNKSLFTAGYSKYLANLQTETERTIVAQMNQIIGQACYSSNEQIRKVISAPFSKVTGAFDITNIYSSSMDFDMPLCNDFEI